MKFVPLIPLIGGLNLPAIDVFGKHPNTIYSYEPFTANDGLYVNYLESNGIDVEMNHIDNSPTIHTDIDIVAATPPCAGLSSLSSTSNADSKTNDWMVESSRFIIENVRPRVLYGENAPALSTKKGRLVALKLFQLAKDNGYAFSLYRTQTKLHGLPQIRNRSFYFFWKTDDATKIPMLPYFNKAMTSIEVILSQERNPNDPMDILVNEKDPDNNPYAQYIKDVLYNNEKTLSQIISHLDKTLNVLDIIEQHPDFIDYSNVSKWMQSHGYDKQAKQSMRFYEKYKDGKNIMKREPLLPKSHTGAFVGVVLTSLVHPNENRFLTIRECLRLMGMPDDFMLPGDNPLRHLGKIPQSVPCTTAKDIMEAAKAFVEGKLDTRDVLSDSFIIQNNVNQSIENVMA